MRLLADENFPRPAIVAILQAGHDLVCIADMSLGAPDPDIFEKAIQQNRIILTLDKDFGEIACKTAATLRCGVILFREPVPSKSEIGRFVVDLLSTRTDWNGYLSVVEGSRVRRRSLIMGR